MRIQVLFNETSVLVPCGAGTISVKELVDKAIVRYKKVLKHHPDDVIEVHNLRLAESGSFVSLDDEVADVLEDKEVVVLEFKLVSHYIQSKPDDHTPDLDAEGQEMPGGMFSNANLADEDIPAFTGNLHHDPLRSSLPNINEVFNHTSSSSQEFHRLEGVVDPATTPTSLNMGPGGSSQDIDIIVAPPWQSQPHSSQDPASPALTRKSSADWRNGSDPGYGSIGTSQPKSQENAFRANVGGEGLQFSPSGHEDFPPPPHIRTSQMDYEGSKVSGEEGGGSNGYSHKEDTRQSKGSSVYGTRDDAHPRYAPGGHHPPPPHSHGGVDFLPMGRGYDPITGRGYDHYHSPHGGGWGYGGVPFSPYEDLASSLDKARFDHLKRRSMSMYGAEHYHPGGGHPYASSPSGGGPMGTYGGRPGGYPDSFDPRGVPVPPGGMGRFGRHHDPHYNHLPLHARMNRAFSHERMDVLPPHLGVRSRHPSKGHPGIDVDPSLDPSMFLSQPTTPYYGGQDSVGGAGAGFGMPMMNPAGHMYGAGMDSRYAMSGPLGVSLSQPGVMISHRPGSYGGMLDTDRTHVPPTWGPSGEKNSQGRGGASLSGGGASLSGGGASLSGGSLERPIESVYRTISVGEEIDMEEDEEESKGENPFSRDYRKSMFRDGNAYSQWMDRMYEGDIQDNSDVPTLQGENSLPRPGPASNHPSSEDIEGGESGDEEIDDVHIVELHKNNEPLGIRLTHYTSEESIDLGVFIASMDPDGFAAKSGKLQVQDRILACNGCDFTKDMTNAHVEEVFTEMIQESLLKMAISRGSVKIGAARGNSARHNRDNGHVGVAEGRVGGVSEEEGAMSSTSFTSISVTITGTTGTTGTTTSSTTTGGGGGRGGGGEVGGVTRPAIKVVAPSAASSQAPPVTLTNTRQIGIRHTIHLTREGSGFGFGLTSRDVSTNEQSRPIYVKTVNHEGVAYQDGRLRIGDRLLQVNGVDVSGLGRPEVVQLLREAKDSVTIVISRQEVVEEEEGQEMATPTSGDSSTQPLTVNKSVLNLDIPLHNCGPAGLGVTVYTKSTSSMVGGEMGVYIKSIVAGGAAAMDGRLHNNDQVLSVNQQNLLGFSNQEAMEILRQAMTNRDEVQLVVARRAAPPSSHSMAALGEEPEEEEDNKEVGIDVPDPIHPPYLSSSSGEIPGRTHSISMSLQSQTSLDNRPPSHSELEPSRGSVRGRAATVSVPSLKGVGHTRTRSGTEHSSYNYDSNGPLRRSCDLLGSGELYDRLEPLLPMNTHPDPAPHLSLDSSHLTSLYDEVAASMTISTNSDISSLDRMDQSSLDRKGMARPPSSSSLSSQRSYPPHMSRGKVGAASASGRHPLSPSDIDLQLYSPTGSDNHAPLHQHRHTPGYSSQFSDSTSITSIGHAVGVADVPIRGSGRKDRNRPERGSGRNHGSGSGSGLSSASPDFTGYATLPRITTPLIGGARVGSVAMDSPLHGSLENLRLSESESNPSFRRDNPGRISITKKTKKNPREDLAHLNFIDSSPLVEGEKAALVRAGSDSFLNEHNETAKQDLMEGLEIGPSLGMAKSSSLESLHNVFHHHIKRDLVDDGPSDLRNRSTRNSYRRTGEHPYHRHHHQQQGEEGEGEEEGDNEEEQRGVDVDFDGISTTPAVISFTKSPHTSTKGGTNKKRGGSLFKIFKKKKTKKDKTSPETTDKARKVSMEISPASLTAEERDQLMKHYTLQLRPQNSQTTLSSLDAGPPGSNRHSMPVMMEAGYDSPGSPDEILLSSMAKV